MVEHVVVGGESDGEGWEGQENAGRIFGRNGEEGAGVDGAGGCKSQVMRWEGEREDEEGSMLTWTSSPKKVDTDEDLLLELGEIPGVGFVNVSSCFGSPAMWDVEVSDESDAETGFVSPSKCRPGSSSGKQEETMEFPPKTTRSTMPLRWDVGSPKVHARAQLARDEVVVAPRPLGHSRLPVLVGSVLGMVFPCRWTGSDLDPRIRLGTSVGSRIEERIMCTHCTDSRA